MRQQHFLTRQQYFKEKIFIRYRPPPYTGCSLAPTVSAVLKARITGFKFIRPIDSWMIVIEEYRH